MDQRYEAHIINYMNLLNINKGLLVLCIQVLYILSVFLLGIFSLISIVKWVKNKCICNSITPYFQNMLSCTVIAVLFFLFFKFFFLIWDKSKFVFLVITSLTHAVHWPSVKYSFIVKKEQLVIVKVQCSILHSDIVVYWLL